MKLSEKRFKEEIKKNSDYFKERYLSNPNFFTFKDKNEIHSSDEYYIKDEYLKEWANEISNFYDEAKNQNLYNDLLERRGGQYSNGTLHSSSRMVAELFRNKTNRIKLFKALNLPLDLQGKWYLEYRLPIFDDNTSHPAQMDLVFISDDDTCCIFVEAKMKEIYKNNYYNDFDSNSEYEEILKKDLKLDKSFNFEHINSKNKFRLIPKNEKYQQNNNFYFKQQICHILGIRNKIQNDINIGNKKRKYIFLNLVFDISKIKGYEEYKDRNQQYIENERYIMNELSECIQKSNIEYKGLITQKLDKLIK